MNPKAPPRPVGRPPLRYFPALRSTKSLYRSMHNLAFSHRIVHPPEWYSRPRQRQWRLHWADLIAQKTLSDEMIYRIDVGRLGLLSLVEELCRWNRHEPYVPTRTFNVGLDIIERLSSLDHWLPMHQTDPAGLRTFISEASRLLRLTNSAVQRNNNTGEPETRFRSWPRCRASSSYADKVGNVLHLTAVEMRDGSPSLHPESFNPYLRFHVVFNRWAREKGVFPKFKFSLPGVLDEVTFRLGEELIDCERAHLVRKLRGERPMDIESDEALEGAIEKARLRAAVRQRKEFGCLDTQRLSDFIDRSEIAWLARKIKAGRPADCEVSGAASLLCVRRDSPVSGTGGGRRANRSL